MNPCYQVMGLQWAEAVGRSAKMSWGGEGEEWAAKTPLCLYFVWQNIYGTWFWGVRSAVVNVDGFVTYGRHDDPLSSFCESAKHGKQLCEEHWLRTLVDGGVIERVK
jgi:hypothetical protein